MPSVYQLLPRTEDQPLVTEENEALDVLAPETWGQLGWCLSDPKQEDTRETDARDDQATAPGNRTGPSTQMLGPSSHRTEPAEQFERVDFDNFLLPIVP